MLDYLVQMMEAGEFQKCLKHAEQQLLRGGMTLAEMATLNFVICRCRLGVNDPYGAINSGLLSIKLAKDTQQWDTVGRGLLSVGTAYMGTRQFDLALEHFYRYFEQNQLYSTAQRFEGAVWRSIGVAHQRKLEPQQAINALNRARQWFSRQGADQSAFSCIHDLVHTYLQQYETKAIASLDPVVNLLAAEKAIALKYPDDTYFRGNHLYDQAAYYLRGGRIRRAIVCAQKAMEVQRGDRQLNFHANMVLCECNQELGDAKQALGYALAARVEAISGKHYELEFIAAQAMVELIREQGAEVVRELDMEYQALGIDLGQYLSPTLLRRHPN